MKTHLKTLSKAAGIVILLITLTTSCKKEKKVTPTPTASTSLSGTIDGKTLKLDAGAITSTYYTTPGDDTKALETSATLNATGDKLNFFIDDVKNGTLALVKKSGTSFAPGSRTLKINANTAGSAGVQTYVSYFSAGNVYYAYSGSIKITVSETTITVEWNISFKDAAGREFNSSGSFTLTNYISNSKPKSEVKDPTLVAAKPTIENIAPTAGQPGDTVSITGTNFSTTPAENDVKFNGATATLKSATVTRIVAFVPQTGTTGALTLKVKNSDVTTGPTFTYLKPPTITAITPSQARVGDTITITGTNFSAVTTDNVVGFNATPARLAGTVINATSTQLKVKVPQGALTGPLTLRVQGGATISSGDFIILTTPPPPVTGSWQNVGVTFNFSDINTVASSGKGVMFANKGAKYLYYSANGTSYSNVIDSLPFTKATLTINQVVTDNVTYYVATNQGLARTTDGLHWQKITPSLNQPNQGFTTMVARRNTVVVTNGSVIYSSTNQGDTWANQTMVTGGAISLDYMFSDSNGKYFYAIDVQRNLGDGVTKSVYRSTDQGKTWSADNTGVTGRYFYGGGYPEFFGATNSTEFLLYAPASQSVPDQRLYRSTNQGSTWTKVSDDLTYFVKASGVTVAYGDTKLHVSNDEGVTFNHISIPEGYIIGGYVKTDDYSYIFCSKGGTTQHKIFRMAN